MEGAGEARGAKHRNEVEPVEARPEPWDCFGEGHAIIQNMNFRHNFNRESMYFSAFVAEKKRPKNLERFL
jgi:hypothetical protein